MSLQRAKNARGDPGRCNLCSADYRDLKDHLNKQHSTHFFVPSDLRGSSLVACPRCGTPCSAGTGLSRHQSRYCGLTAPRIRRNRVGNSTNTSRRPPSNTAASPIVLSPSPERPSPLSLLKLLPVSNHCLKPRRCWRSPRLLPRLLTRWKGPGELRNPFRDLPRKVARELGSKT